MPTYEYLCQSCSHRFEAWQKMTEDPLSNCPECGEHVRRVLYPAGVVFKGSGFYKTDHGSSTLAAKDANGEAKKTEDKGTTTSESKPSENGTTGKNSGTGTGSTGNTTSTATAVAS